MNRITAAQRSHTLKWISAHVSIFGNEQADNLTKDAQNSSEFSNSLILSDARKKNLLKKLIALEENN